MYMKFLYSMETKQVSKYINTCDYLHVKNNLYDSGNRKISSITAIMFKWLNILYSLI